MLNQMNSAFFFSLFKLKVARPSLSGSIPPKFEHNINYVSINKDLEKLPPQFCQTEMKICYDQGCNDIGFVIATK